VQNLDDVSHTICVHLGEPPKSFDDMCICLDTIPQRDGQTDGTGISISLSTCYAC